MGSDAWNPSGLCILPEHLPYCLFTQAFARNSVGAIHRTEDVAIGHVGPGSPGIDRHLDPVWHRDGPYAAVLANEVDDAPASVPLLHMRESHRGHFGSPETAAEQHCENRAIA